MKEFLNNVMMCFLKGAIFGGVFTIVFCIIQNTIVASVRRMKAFAPYNPLKGEKRTPVKPPHSVEAHFLDSVYLRYSNTEPKDSSDADWKVIYEYEVDGKKYKYKRKCIRPTYDSEITLYYRKNPANAKEKDIYGGVENDWIPAFLISSAVGIMFNFLFLGTKMFFSMF